ncbi:hypothetical protein [Azohydromonas australica]|uniref:hypothetical protein n=1 Tax=Azohydromonas australica TaxID=364039 RepID=UPI00041E74FF|nr:hypothetical protein [Azohydromonas australica]
MLLKRHVAWAPVAATALGLALVSLALAAPSRELLLAFAGGALFAWLFMRLAAPSDSTRGGENPWAHDCGPADAQAERAWQDTVPGPYSE